QGKKEMALPYFIKSVKENPEGRHIQDAMYLKFAAEYMEKEYEGTLKTIAEYLTQFPKGKYAANGLYYKAMCLASLKQWDDALATINTVIDSFPKGTDSFQAVDEAFYQKGWMLNEMKKPAEAVTHLEAFLDRFKESALCAEAMYQLGIALNAGDDLEKAKSILQSIPKEYPDSYISPMALYQVAVMYFEKKDFPQMAEALKVLIQLYPDNPIITDAYFWLGWIAREDERYDDAIESLTKCVESDPDGPRAPESMQMIARSYKDKAESMGSAVVLPEKQRAVYRATILKAAREFENLMAQYPASTQMLESVPGIASAIFDLVRYRQMTEKEAVDYFTEAMARHPDDSNVKAQLSYSMGSFLMKNNQEDKALEAFKKALTINPEVRLSPIMLTEYAEALKEANALGESEAVYKKIIADYPDAPLSLAPAWYGLADIKYRENDFEAAKELFEKVLKDFEWYVPGKQGRVMLAKILERNKKYAEAEKMFEEVWRQERGPDARLGAMLGVSRCQLAQAEIAKKKGDALTWKENIKVADKNLSKIIVLFPGLFPEIRV
ncbi:tetratricopeptide repeat protein, partial [Verrucomicrobiota bacterium]